MGDGGHGENNRDNLIVGTTDAGWPPCTSSDQSRFGEHVFHLGRFWSTRLMKDTSMTTPSNDEIDRLLSDPTIQAESPQREIIATLRSLTDTWRHYVPRNDAEETALGALFNANAVQIQGTRRKPYARLAITGSRWKEMLEKASDPDRLKVVYMILKLVWECNPESTPAIKVVEPKEFERLLADLEKLGSQFPEYSGTVEKCIGGVGLRYYRHEDFDLIVDKTGAEKWNLAVRELDRISMRVIQIIEQRQEILTPEYVTLGAAVMAWVLRDNWPKNRVSATCIGNAFLTIRDRLIEDRLIQDGNIEVGLVKSLSAKVPLYDDDVYVGMVDLSGLTKLCTSLLRQDKRQGTLYRDEAGRFIYHVWDYDEKTMGRTCQLMGPADAYEVALKAEQFFVVSDELIAELAGLKLDGQSYESTKRPNAVRKQADATKPQSSGEADDKLPQRLRKVSDSRIKAKAAYDYAMLRIPNAHAMTIPELHAAILDDPEVSDMVPEKATSFGTYLRQAGVKQYKLNS